MTSKIKALAFTAFILNLFDALATLFIINKGGIEVNPIMAHAIEVGPWFFILIKIVLFTLAIVLIIKHVPRFLKWVVGAYSLLACWHIWLLSKIYLSGLAGIMSWPLL
jgi:hypothetical protein